MSLEVFGKVENVFFGTLNAGAFLQNNYIMLFIGRVSQDHIGYPVSSIAGLPDFLSDVISFARLKNLKLYFLKHIPDPARCEFS